MHQGRPIYIEIDIDASGKPVAPPPPGVAIDEIDINVRY